MDCIGITKRILQVFKEGTALVRIHNRLSDRTYELSENYIIRKYIEQSFPERNIASLSDKTCKILAAFSEVFSKKDIKNIVYIGAHDGSMAISFNEAFPGCTFYLFEPVPETFSILKNNTKQYPNMNCFNYAIGATFGQVRMFKDDFSAASSILPYESVCMQEFPFLGKQTEISVKIRCLDDIVQTNNIPGVDLMIIDTQGFEDEVLKGAEKILTRCKAIVCEMSLRHLYKDSSSFSSIYQTMCQHGFELDSIADTIKGRSGMILQIDGVFLKREKHA